MFYFFKILIFWVHRGGKRAKNSLEWQKILSVVLHVSGTYIIWLSFMVKMCNMIISPGAFFNVKILIFQVIEGLKGENDENFCLSHLIFQEPYIIYCDFWCTRVKWWYIQQIFSFFKILIFGVFRGWKGKKWPKVTNFDMFCSISQELWIISSRFW